MGHRFQNRYRSIVAEEEPYLLELVRHLHLNPLRAHGVSDLRALDRYPWTGYSALVGTVPRPWQDTATILTQLGPTRRRAVLALRRDREAHHRDECVLGGSTFVDHLRRTRANQAAPRPARLPPEALVARVCRHVGTTPATVAAGGRPRRASRAREGIAFFWTAVLGHPGRPLAPVLGIRP